MTEILSIRIEDNLRQIKNALQEARDYTNTSMNASGINASDTNAGLASGNMSR